MQLDQSTFSKQDTVAHLIGFIIVPTNQHGRKRKKTDERIPLRRSLQVVIKGRNTT